MLIKEIWKNRSLILQGLKNKLFSSKKIKLMARARMEVCKVCPYNSSNTNERPQGNLVYNHCIQCGCMLALKTFSEDSECPINKW